MPLTLLNCSDNRISDLSPLQGMPLHTLYCASNAIRHLHPLCGLPLERLGCAANQLDDLTPIANLPLQWLSCPGNAFRDLSPLRTLPLRTLDIRSNHIADLSALATMPLTHLSCGYNPLTDLRPLRGMPLTDLSLEGIALPPDALRIIEELPLTHLVCKLSAGATLITHHATLVAMNHHIRAYYQTLASPLLHTVQDWQAHATTRHDLRQYAAPSAQDASVSYLAVPIRLSRSAAEDFCRFVGGTLVCPASAEQYEALLAYLQPITYYETNAALSYHLGLEYDTAEQRYRWQSGEPYQWAQWVRPMPTPPRAVTALFTTDFAHDSSHWDWDDNPCAYHYTVVQWA